MAEVGRRLRIAVVGPNLRKGGGLSKDLAVLQAALDREYQLTAFDADQFSLGRGVGSAFWKLVARKAAFAATIFLQNARRRCLDFGGINILIPNPEWPVKDRVLHRMDRIFCKTEHAVAVYRARLPEDRVVFTGFTAIAAVGDAALAAGGRPGALHVAGTSHLKGTNRLVDVWLLHPEWPTLTLVAQRNPSTPREFRPRRADNIRWIADRISDGELAVLRHANPIHILPSEAEGFGHSLAESLACGALVVTTDAPPMNEIVTPDRGLLVREECTTVMGHAACHHVGIEALQRACQHALDMTIPERMRFGSAARDWFVRNGFLFQERMVGALRKALAGN